MGSEIDLGWTGRPLKMLEKCWVVCAETHISLKPSARARLSMCAYFTPGWNGVMTVRAPHRPRSTGLRKSRPYPSVPLFPPARATKLKESVAFPSHQMCVYQLSVSVVCFSWSKGCGPSKYCIYSVLEDRGTALSLSDAILNTVYISAWRALIDWQALN